MNKPIRPVKVKFVCYTNSFTDVIFTKVFKTYRSWSVFEDKLKATPRYVQVDSYFCGYEYR